ncbi:hypothetical protein [Nonomuraea sp. NPDC049480]|uniref:hypothetical protein n=1 Tax=Nonomuraea sp. NPDC049480 TaxID=3364353 RepID=UPI0037B563A7
MLPVTKIATGFVIAFGALRINGFDLLLDPVGWGLCASGLAQLHRSPGDGFDPARTRRHHHGLCLGCRYVPAR